LDADVAREKFGLLDSMLVLRCGTVGFERSYARDYRQIYGKAAQKKGPQNQNPHGQYNYFSTEFHPLDRGSDLHTMQSVTKTITSDHDRDSDDSRRLYRRSQHTSSKTFPLTYN